MESIFQSPNGNQLKLRLENGVCELIPLIGEIELSPAFKSTAGFSYDLLAEILVSKNYKQVSA